MAYTPNRIVGPVGVTSSHTIIHSVTQKTIVKQIIITNYSGSTLPFSMFILPSNGAQLIIDSGLNLAVLDPYKLYGDITLTNNTTFTFEHSLILNAGEQIAVKSTTSNCINVYINGVTI
jgi:hypothetical protein